jgi:hypothetical protein
MLMGRESSLMFIGALLVNGIGHFGIKLNHIGTHMATSVERGCGLHLQPSGKKISLNQTLAAKLKQSVDPEIAGYVAENICVLAVDIAFDDPVVSYQQLGFCRNIAVERAIDANVTVAADITLDDRTCSYDGRAAGWGFGRLGFCSEHMTIFILLRK